MAQTPAAKPSSADSAAAPFRFRLVHVIYMVTMFGVSLGAFGIAGVLPATVVATFWTVAYTRGSRRTGFWKSLLLFCLCVACGGGLLLPGVGGPRVARRAVCSNNIRQIALALHSYHQQYKEFPPAHLGDANGKPMHSWRVLILPFLEREDLYAKYRFDEPWDGPNNRQLLEPMMSVFACPSQTNSPYTSYVAVVGPDTAWPGATSRKLADIGDPHDQTILVVESAVPQIFWMEPRDLTYEEAVNYLSGATEIARHDAHWYSGYFEEQYSGRMVAMADGNVQFADGLIERDIWARLFSISDGGTHVSVANGVPSPIRRLYFNYVRLAVWIIIVLWPTPFALAGKFGHPRRRSGSVSA
jgi:hypothetical protein